MLLHRNQPSSPPADGLPVAGLVKNPLGAVGLRSVRP
jgi:hypothetical protein